jgi:hypothetical protein
MTTDQKIMGMCVTHIQSQQDQISTLTEQVTFLHHHVEQLVKASNSPQHVIHDHSDDHPGITFHGTEAHIRCKGYYPVCSKSGDTVLYSMREERKLVVLSESQIASIRTIQNK